MLDRSAWSLTARPRGRRYPDRRSEVGRENPATAGLAGRAEAGNGVSTVARVVEQLDDVPDLHVAAVGGQPGAEMEQAAEAGTRGVGAVAPATPIGE